MAQSITLTKVYNEVKQIQKKMLTRQELQSLVDTLEIISNDFRRG